MLCLTRGYPCTQVTVVSPTGGGYPCLNTRWVQVMAFEKMTGTRTCGYSPVLHLRYIYRRVDGYTRCSLEPLSVSTGSTTRGYYVSGYPWAHGYYLRVPGYANTHAMPYDRVILTGDVIRQKW